MNKVLPYHLGGHMNITHTDRSTFLHVKNKYDITSMIDVGCGPGGMIEIARDRGVSVMGVDGDFTLTETWNSKNIDVVLHDFTQGAPKIPKDFDHVDLVWSVEFLEHVYEEYLPNIFDVFKRADYVVATAAPPGSGGHHHVNERPLDYWIEQFADNGFVYDEEESNYIKENSVMRKGFMKRSGMFFHKLHKSV